MNLLLVAILNLSVGFLTGVLSIPLITRGVGRNGSYGFRFETSFQSDEAWYAINSYGGKWILFWSLIILATGGLCLFAHLDEDLNLAKGMQVSCLFAPCLLLISGAQASIWASKHFPINSAEPER